MFTLNDDLSIYATRGDIVFFSVTAEDDGEPYKFKAGDVVRIKIYGKKNAENVVLEKDFPVTEDAEEVEIYLDKEDTKIGSVISKPKDYWYEVELNPYTNPQTIIGYDEDGAKVFKLFPEGADIPAFEPNPEDYPFMDDELDMVSTRPVQNQAIARAVVSLRADFEKTKEDITNKSNDASAVAAAVKNEVAAERARVDSFVALKEGSTTGDAELLDGRISNDGYSHTTIGNHIRDVNAQLDERFGELQIEGYEGNDFFKDIKSACEKVEGKFFRYPDSDAMASEQWNFYTYPVKAGERYRIKTYTVSAGRAVAFMAMEYDAAEIDPAIGCYPENASSGEIVDVVVTVPVGAVQMLVNENLSYCEAHIGKFASRQFSRKDVYNSPLKGKTLVCCGDSITEAINPAGGYFTNYAELVAERLGMICYKDGVGGSTMAYGKGKSFSIGRYLNVPAFDYLTIWFGWNDAAYSELGTIDDVGNETFYGAYKMVLEHLITNNPTKKIGIIVPYGSDAVNPFAQAVRELSDMYGVPCLDLKNHNKCSLLWGTANAAQLARRAALTYDGTHPNQDGYDYLSNMYEQFLLSL